MIYRCIFQTFWVSGSCPYGKRCCFIHTELPANGQSPATPGSENPPEARPRSMSTNSDPNDSTVSLLARISAKRTESNTSSLATPVELSSNNVFHYPRPEVGKLRVNTSVPVTKQNKSAFPSFASNNTLPPAGDQTPSTTEPAPVTAGPDLGRQHNARLEIVGFNHVSTSAFTSGVYTSDILFSRPPSKRPRRAPASAIPSMERRSLILLLFPLAQVTLILSPLVTLLRRHMSPTPLLLQLHRA